MNLWQLLKQKFEFGSKTENHQKQFDRTLEAAVDQSQAENYLESQRLFLKAFEAKPENLDPQIVDWLLSWLMYTFEATEDYEQAANFYGQLHYARGHQLRAGALWYGGRLTEAIAEYSKALELDPSDVWMHSERGQVYAECEEFSLAIQDLNIALGQVSLVPDSSKTQFEAYTRNGLGAAYAGLGDDQKAHDEFNKSIALCPENGWVYFNRAEAYLRQGDKTRAAENYLSALELKNPKLTKSKRLHAHNTLTQLRSQLE